MKQANSKQKQWRKDITEFIQENGFYDLYGEYFNEYNFDRHHVLGKAARHNKIDIGHWFIIPVPKELHDVHSNNNNNVTHFKHNFTKKYGYQRAIFKNLCDMMLEFGYEIPPKNVCDAIQMTSA